MRVKISDVELQMAIPSDKFILAIFTNKHRAGRFKREKHMAYGDGTKEDVTIYKESGQLRNGTHKLVYAVIGGAEWTETVSRGVFVKIEQKQRYITSDENLLEYGYIKWGMRGCGKQRWCNKSFKPHQELTLKEKISSGQPTILTLEDLSECGYLKHAIGRTGDTQWVKANPKEILSSVEKVKRGFITIDTNDDLSKLGYYNSGTVRGGKMRWARKDVIRERARKRKATRRCLKYLKINKRFENSHAHHTNKDCVLYIPKQLHKSVWHNIFTGENMNEMNDLAFQWIATQEDLQPIGVV